MSDNRGRSLSAAFGDAVSSVYLTSRAAFALAWDTIHEFAIGRRTQGLKSTRKRSKLRKPAVTACSFARDQEPGVATGVIRPDYAPVDLDVRKNAAVGDRNEASSEVKSATRPPSFLRRRSRYKPKRTRKAAPSSIFSRLAEAKNLLLLQRIDLHPAEKSFVSTTTNRGGWAPGIVITLLCLLGLVAASFLIKELVSLKSEDRRLRQEISKLRENLGRLEQMVKTQKEAYQKHLEISADAEVGAGQQSAIELSKDEIQYIREYIKPAPGTALAGSAVNVGDLFDGATIPLPAPLVDKIPKLLGARFAIRNGAIVILKRGSRRVNAILPSN